MELNAALSMEVYAADTTQETEGEEAAPTEAETPEPAAPTEAPEPEEKEKKLLVAINDTGAIRNTGTIGNTGTFRDTGGQK